MTSKRRLLQSNLLSYNGSQDDVGSSNNNDDDVSVLDTTAGPSSKRPRITRVALNADADGRRAGTIEQIVLENFMCHSMLKVNLGRNVTLLTGRNGSGKSAILTAMVVGLGGRVALTNRAQNVRSLVKSDQTSATIEITLFNGGLMAYRPATYGERIIIQRHINGNSGASSYKIRNAEGDVLSKSATEVTRITTALNIQIDNPVCILNQDVSRSFLNTSNNRRKFELLMKATRLDMLSEQFTTTEELKNQSVTLLHQKEQKFQETQEHLKKLKEQIDVHRKINVHTANLAKAESELLWSIVVEMDIEVAQLKTEIDEYQTKIVTLTDTKANRLKTIDEIKQSIGSMQTEMIELKSTVTIETQNLNEMKSSTEEFRGEFNTKQNQQNILSERIRVKTINATQLKDEIEHIEERTAQIERQKTESLNRQASLKQDVKAIESRIQTCQNDLFQLRSELERVDSSYQNVKHELDSVNNRLERERNDLHVLRNSSENNALLLYGQHIPQVVQLIQRNRSKFRELPRGPLGSYIQIKDKKWAVAAENHLAADLLHAFTVDNIEDRMTLLALFKSMTGHRNEDTPTIITSKYFNKKHAIERFMVRSPRDCVALADLLVINDPIVFNVIVDQAAIENILLVPSDDRAIDLLSNSENVPENCHQAITIEGNIYYPDPDYRTYCAQHRRARYLQIDMKEHVKSLERHIEKMDEEKQLLSVQREQMRCAISQHQTNRQRLEETIRKLTVEREQIRKTLNEFVWSVDSETINPEILMEQLNSLEADLKQLRLQQDRINHEIAAFKLQFDETNAKCAQLRSSVAQLETRYKSLEATVQEKSLRRTELTVNSDYDGKQIEVFKEKLQKAEAEYNNKNTALERETTKATAVCRRPKNVRLPPELLAEINSLKNSIRRGQANIGNVEEVTNQYHELNNRLEVAHDLLGVLNDDLRELKKALRNRNTVYKLTESYFITKIKYAFKRMLEMRKFSGQINIDMSKKNVELHVMPQEGSKELTTTSNLSGGERSFSTVAFLYALWHCMDFPFYVLDEFDVYMDKMNRTKVIEILIQYANIHPSLQFIFLTPQDVTVPSSTDSVTVLKLSDPV